MTRPNTSRGFTIMEVMVAIMILAVSVVSIFGAQFAAVATTEYSKHITQAINLAECRMNEIELEVLTDDGFKLGNVESSGECCESMEDEKIGDYECSWEIKVVEIPDLGFAAWVEGERRGRRGEGVARSLDAGHPTEVRSARVLRGRQRGTFEVGGRELGDALRVRFPGPGR